MLTLLMLVLDARAEGSMQIQGRLKLPEGGGRGEITIDPMTIEVETHGLFSTRSLTVKLNDARSVRVVRGLWHTKVLMEMKDDSFVSLVTQRGLYDGLKALLKERIT